MGRPEDITKAALSLFAEKGFAATSMNEIAEKAGVAKSLIYHHFSSKEELWQKIKEEKLVSSGLEERILEMVSAETPEKFIACASGPDGYFHFLKKNPEFVRMLAWLNAENTFPEQSPCELHDSMHEKMIGILKDQQDNGLMDKEIDPEILVLIFISICDYWFTGRGKLSCVIGKKIHKDEMDQEYIETACRILMKGTMPE